MSGVLMKEFGKKINYITRYYKELITRTKAKQSIGSINEWIVDNYYIISEQEKYIQSEYFSLPIRKIKNKRKKVIFDLVYRYLKENDLNADINYLFKKINSYQQEAKDYFSYYEINYIYLIVRIILINELYLLSKRLKQKLTEKDEVDKKFNLINAKTDPNNFNLEDYIRVDKSIIEKPYYIEQLNYKLREMGHLSENAFIKLNELFLKNKISLREVINESHNDMAKDNILMINIFNSIKKIVRYKIEYFYKNISYTEKTLIGEEASIYDNIYDNNKGTYRSKIIKLAKKQKTSEYNYALDIVAKANKEKKHVGWYLFKQKNNNVRAALYVFTIVFLTIFISFFMSKYTSFILLPIVLIPICGFVVEVINQIILHFTKPESVFKLKFEEGLPKEYSAMVVLPTLIKDSQKVKKMFDKLEVYYLSNHTDNLYFTLLGDCSSESVKDKDVDKEIINAGLNKVNELNEKYGRKIFNFIYRNRFYSEGEGYFLGFERKRGALNHFNKLILNKLSEEQKKEYFNCHTFDGFDADIKYVITLDTDTKLVLNTALKLIGAMAHPLNKAVLSSDHKKVVKGYGIMQPRVSIDVEVTNKSVYSQLFAGLGGLDIYTTACFDLYQDIFYEGSFVGKGIYDLKIFDEVLDSAFPNNLILSHDLLEGNYLRCGFIDDVELFDDYPVGYLNDTARHHRWTRGDWQIISWLKKRIKNVKGETVKNPISLLSKWKIFDNLRRSLMSIFLLLIIFYGFIFGRENPIYYVIITIAIIAIPILFYLFSKVVYRSKSTPFLKYYLSLIRGIVAVINKSFIIFAVLPYEAWLYTDAIIRALYRMYISKKRLLNWITAEELDKITKNNFESYLRSFRANYIASALLIIACILFKPAALYVSLIIVAIWLFAPYLMYIVSKSIKVKEITLDYDEKLELIDLALKTWGYFDEFLTEEHNYLIPDNYQFNREKKVDYKTSPTNIGFSLVSVVSASELEMINPEQAVNLITNIVRTIEKLNKWNGHLYNWYDIYTLKELGPYFISTVDNGNFVASLYVAKGFVNKYGNKELLYRISKLIDETDFSHLYNNNLDVLSIGYNGGEKFLLNYHYNNFASESRLTSYIAIAKGDAPYKHWFCLDKTLTKYKCYKGMASWSGTAFEYFMPLIFMKTYQHTLIDETYYFAYYAQKEFIKNLDSNLPWGLSESAYDELDDSENYRYKAFGVPYLKMQDSISYPIVISPYSSILAIEVDDREVYHNLQKLKKLDMYGEYGFYEAYDNEDKAVIKNYYAHHQGMILGSLTNYLKDGVIRNYFHGEKQMEAIEMLLKEKVQIKTYIDLKMEKYKKYQYSKTAQESDVREYNELKSIPEMGVLSNGYYSVLINDRGVGLSKYKNLQINRARMIPSDNYGLFVYIKNLNDNSIWSNTYDPLHNEGEKYKVVFASDRIKYIKENNNIVTTTEISVVKDHNAEIRKITFRNNTNTDITLEVTSYGEVIMCRNDEDVAHRAFNNLTINSEIDEDTSSLIFNRKSRTKENTRYYVVNRLFMDDDTYPFEYETSRNKFIGRNNTTSNPDIIMNGKPLSKTIGSADDPIMSIRKHVKIKAKEKETIYLLVGFGKSREQVMEIVRAYKDEFSINKAFDITTFYNNMHDSYLNLEASQRRLFNDMLKYFYQTLPLTNDRKQFLLKNSESQSDLWKFGIAGDLPIILVEISKLEDVGFVREVLQAYEYYKGKGLYIDIVIINSEETGKEKMVQDYINNQMYLINNLNYFEDSPGSVYIVSGATLNLEDKVLFSSIAILSLNASNGKSLEEQVNDINLQMPRINRPVITCSEPTVISSNEVEYYNGFGGFVNNGKEYFINKVNTPAPWANVVANDHFGFVITNNMGGFTYANNSREFKLTSWSNDMILDPTSEAIVINNHKFKPSYVKHGFGYSTFFSGTHEYDAHIKVFAGKDEDIKFYELTVTNKLNSEQPMTFDFILNLVLGTSEELTNRYLVTHFDELNNCLYVRNVYNKYFNDINVFISSTEKIIDFNDYDPIYKSITIKNKLKANETKTFSFIIGCERKNDVLDKYQSNVVIKEEYEKVVNCWKNRLSFIEVNTPDKALNYALNGWYLYQLYTSRLLAKTGFYQVSGAIGFRDQLQDAMGVIYCDENRTRMQILEHAKHQFKEGDVLHWWHECLLFGSRTKFSDDYLWLVYVTYEYLRITNDYSILNEQVCFVDGEKLNEFESGKGMSYTYTKEQDTLYNHLKLCINRAISLFGKNNLPLMGSGDWNDGMDRVGYKGKGESVFVGLLLYDILLRMANMSNYIKDDSFGRTCMEKRVSLKEALDQNAWDGAWYLRAYFDNGVPLGSRNNSECQIDLLCQAWSVLSDAASPEKRVSLFKEAEHYLVDKEHKFIKLLTPPFKDTRNNPGYIKDYIVGVRENGGQYTHAAMWYILALLKDGQFSKAYEYYEMLNPINRASNYDDAIKYKVEPYVIVADVYANSNNIAQGGWTWYTGSACWAYKIGIEEIIGFKKEGNKLRINPKIDVSWDSFSIAYRYCDTLYDILVVNKNHVNSGVKSVTLDDKLLEDNIILLENDKMHHKVVVNMEEKL